MLGFAFFAAQAEFLKTLDPWPQPMIMHTGYPGIKLRLSVIFNHLIADNNKGNIRAFLKRSLDSVPDKANPLLEYINAWGARLNETQDASKPHDQEESAAPSLEQQLTQLAEKAVRRSLRELNSIARKTIPDDKCARLTPKFFERIERLKYDLPPFCTDEDSDCFAEIMSASWAYQLLYGEQREFEKKEIKEKFEEYSKACRLILKAIELMPASQGLSSEDEATSGQQRDTTTHDKAQSETKPTAKYKSKPLKGPKMWLDKSGVLSGPFIRQRIERDLKDPLHIDVTPLNPKAIKGASLDVHLGNWFVVARRTKLKGVQIGDKSDEELLRTIGREEVFVPTDKSFLIHPGDLILGATLEFLALPNDLMAFVEGRSSLGRMGLIVATATQVAPGFHGVIVLELANAGTVPLELKPGKAIAQLVFQVMTESVPEDYRYKGRYDCQIKP